MMLRNRGKEGFADFLVNRFNPDYEYSAKEKEINTRDFRIDKPRTIDINARYNEFKSFVKSDAYHNTQIATNLLSLKFSVSTEQLTSTLQSKHGMSREECQDVLKNMANSKHVDVRKNHYTNEVVLRKLQ